MEALMRLNEKTLRVSDQARLCRRFQALKLTFS